MLMQWQLDRRRGGPDPAVPAAARAAA